MKTKEDLVQFYRGLNSLISGTDDENGAISIDYGDGDKIPFLAVFQEDDAVSKRVFLPIDKVLARNISEDEAVFHILRQTPYQCESIIQRAYRERLLTRINMVIMCLVDNIIELALSPPASCSKDKISLASSAVDADQKTLDNWRYINNNLSPCSCTKSATNIYIRKLGMIKGSRFPAIGVLAFPLYKTIHDAVSSKKYRFASRDLRLKDWACYKSIFEYIFKDIEKSVDANDETFKFAVEGQVALLTEAMLKPAQFVMNSLNKVSETLFKGKTHLTKEESADLYAFTHFDTEFLDAPLEEYSEVIDLIPEYNGNGSVSKKISAQPAPVAQAEKHTPKHSFIPRAVKETKIPQPVETTQETNKIVRQQPVTPVAPMQTQTQQRDDANDTPPWLLTPAERIALAQQQTQVMGGMYANNNPMFNSYSQQQYQFQQQLQQRLIAGNGSLRP